MVASTCLTNARVQVIITPVECGMELLADMMIMLGTIFYLRKGQQSDYPSFRYICPLGTLDIVT
jgi:hypothetical protein